MTETAPAPPGWKYTGILVDLLQPVLDKAAGMCVVDGNDVRWVPPFTVQGAFDTGTDRNEQVVEHQIINEGCYSNTSIDWAETLLAEHLSDDDIFVHSLAGPTTTFKTHVPQAHAESLTGEPLTDLSIDIIVEWTTPRRVNLKPTTIELQMGPTGSGKSTTMYALIAAMQDEHPAVFKP